MREASFLEIFADQIEGAANAAAFVTIFGLLPICATVWFAICRLGL